MNWLMLTLAAFVCFLLVFYIKHRQYNQPALKFPYRLRPQLLDEEERELLEQIQAAAGDDHYVLARVRLAEVVEVTAVPRRSPWYHAHNRIAHEHVDFLLCRKRDLAPACAIAYDGGPGRDMDFMDELCRTVGLPLVTLSAESVRTYGEVRGCIGRALDTHAEPVRVP